MGNEVIAGKGRERTYSDAYDIGWGFRYGVCSLARRH
jgi:hypothetical protein